MKIGDLVTLSAYGRKVKRTGWIKDGDIGIIKALTHRPWDEYEVLWTKSQYKYRYQHQRTLDRRDLKYVK